MDPEDWTNADTIAAWIFMLIPLAAGMGLGRLVNYLRTREEKNSDDRRHRFW